MKTMLWGVSLLAVVGLTMGGCSWYSQSEMVRETGWGTGAAGMWEWYAGENTDEIRSLVNQLEDGNTTQKICAANALGEMGDRAGTNHVVEGLEDLLKKGNEPMVVRFAAARALQKIGSSNAIHTLHEAEDRDRIPIWRDYSVLAPYDQMCPTQFGDGTGAAGYQTQTGARKQATGAAGVCPPAQYQQDTGATGDQNIRPFSGYRNEQLQCR